MKAKNHTIALNEIFKAWELLKIPAAACYQQQGELFLFFAGKSMEDATACLERKSLRDLDEYWMDLPLEIAVYYAASLISFDLKFHGEELSRDDFWWKSHDYCFDISYPGFCGKIGMSIFHPARAIGILNINGLMSKKMAKALLRAFDLYLERVRIKQLRKYCKHESLLQGKEIYEKFI